MSVARAVEDRRGREVGRGDPEDLAPLRGSLPEEVRRGPDWTAEPMGSVFFELITPTSEPATTIHLAADDPEKMTSKLRQRVGEPALSKPPSLV